MCTFCAIERGEIQAHMVLDDEHAIAFLDHRPVFEGHTLLAPRKHVETLGDLPDEMIEPLFVRARLLARAVQAGLEADGTFVAMNNIVSQSVPHLHLHIVPRRRKDGLRGFFWPRTKYGSEEEAAAIAASIRAALAPDPRPDQ
jgi:histidine triad (HIT) family protein